MTEDNLYERDFGSMRIPRYRAGIIGAGLYLLVCFFAGVYPLFSHQTFAGLPAVMLAWPWVDYFSFGNVVILLGVVLNALIIYGALGMLTALFSSRGSGV